MAGLLMDNTPISQGLEEVSLALDKGRWVRARVECARLGRAIGSKRQDEKGQRCVLQVVGIIM